MINCRLAIVGLLVAGAGCTREPVWRTYQLTGQVLAVKLETNEILVKHDDIPGFMPAMTMPYKVPDAAILEGKKPGDLISATLVVAEVEAHLSRIETVGHAALDVPPALDAPRILEPGATAADARLVNQDGTPTTWSSLRGHRVALTFVYTRCPVPNYCPLMNRHFARVQQELKRVPALADVRLVSVTLDPEFDTPGVLKAHARTFEADPAVWTFLTGEPAEVSRFVSQFGIHFERDAQDAAQLIHNLRTAVIDPEGRLVSVESGNEWTPAELLADLSAAPAPVN